VGIALNWIAQGVLVAGAAGFGLWLLPAGRARARMRVWWTVVATVLCLPLVSWLLATLAPVDAAPAGVGRQPLVAVPLAVWTATSLASALWLAWAGVQSLRFGLEVRALLRVRRGCRALPESVARRLRPSTRLRLAKSGACLMASPDVRAAAVLGCGPPIIAVQPALIEQLTDSELDQVVVHEWAHVSGRDTLAALVESVVHVAAGWHPAVWFAARRLRLEREMACDEVAVEAAGSAKAYAACLTRVAALAHASRGSRLAVAMLSSPGLTRRVLRLLARQKAPAFASRWMMVPAALAVVVAVGSGQLSVFGAELAPLAALIDVRPFARQPGAPAAAAPTTVPRRATSAATRSRSPRAVEPATAAVEVVVDATERPTEQIVTAARLAASGPEVNTPPAVASASWRHWRLQPHRWPMQQRRRLVLRVCPQPLPTRRRTRGRPPHKPACQLAWPVSPSAGRRTRARWPRRGSLRDSARRLLLRSDRQS
jgi:beta-lactamase regulating signal transducer with metallopeptidase domain